MSFPAPDPDSLPLYDFEIRGEHNPSAPDVVERVHYWAREDSMLYLYTGDTIVAINLNKVVVYRQSPTPL